MAFLKDNAWKLFAIAVYFAICVIVFLPVIANPGEILFGKIGDSTSAIWLFWASSEFGFSKTGIINFPDGIQLQSVQALPVLKYVLVPLSGAIGALPAYNLYAFFGLFLSFVAMFFLARHFLKDNLSSFVSGLVFGLSPYLFMKASSQVTLMHLEFVAFFVLTLFLFKEKPSILRALAVSFSLFLTLFFETYYFFFSIVFLLIFLLYYLYSPFLNFARTRSFKTLLSLKRFIIPAVISAIIFFALFFAIVAPLLIPAVSDFGLGLGAQGLRGSFYSLLYFSAKPVQFITPSVYHPLLGSIALDVIPAQASSDFGEGTLYVGFSVLFLALFAVLKERKNRIVCFFVFCVISVLALMQGPLLRYINFFGIFIAFFPLVLALWLFYIGRKTLAKAFFAITFLLIFLPALYGFLPTLQQAAFDITRMEQLQTASAEKIIAYLERFDYFPIPMPSLLLYKLVPFFRVYERLAVLLMLALAILAGFGAKRLISSQKSQKAKIVVAGFICAVIIFEFLPLPPDRVTQLLPMPLEYGWLLQQPAGTVVAEYPLSMFPYYGFYQQFHQKKLFNSLDMGSGLGGKEKLIAISKQETIDELKKAGVDYLIIHSDTAQLFSQNFPDQEYFRQKFASSKEALEISAFVEGKGYKKLSRVILVNVFEKTFVFKLE